VKSRLHRQFAGPVRKIIALVLAVLVVAAIALVVRPTGAPGVAVHTENETIPVAGGPGVPGQVQIDATLYVPAVSGPLPAVLMAHGFGGSKDSIAGDARTLAAQGFVVLAYSARGFGHSTGQIALDSLDYEVPDARALISWLATRPEVLLDGPGDPRVGVTGASYGGALALMLAGTDPRVDAVVPLITWNDLSTALFPNAIETAGSALPRTPAQTTPSTDGVFKKAWAANLMVSVISGAALGGNASATASAAPATARGADLVNSATPGCGRMMPALCAAYSSAAQTGVLNPTLAALLARSSPKAVIGNIKAPTLLVQGERDTLFGLDQADANARAISAKGTTVGVTWYGGGHDSGGPDQVTRDQVTNWLTFYLKNNGQKPSTSFNYGVDGLISGTGRPRTLQVPSYPGLAGAPAVTMTQVPLLGPQQSVLNPPGGAPAGISSIPGLSSVAGSALAAVSGGLPGQVARFRSAAMPALTVIAGTPRVSVTFSSSVLPSGDRATAPASSGAVFFASLTKISAGGVRTLAGSAVAPIRITDLPTDGTAKTVMIELPAVALQVEAGASIEVDLSTTDQAYAGPTSPAVYQVSLPAGAQFVSLPKVGGVRVSASDFPIGTLIALGVIVVIAVLWLTLAGRVRRHRPRSAAGESSAVPLEITGLGKSYPGGVMAVTDVSFRIERGQVLGLLGPNGAGKTTTLRMVMGLITPTAGSIKVFGQPVSPGADILARIGSFVEGAGFLPHLSGKANLDLYWRATGRPAADAHMAEALQIAALGKPINRRVKTYSQGMRQRLAIAQAMLGLPDLLLLDEPTNGLDPPQIHAMREVLRGYAATGRTVLVSSHMLSEVEQTCSHVVVIHQGRSIAAGTVAAMVAASGIMVFTVDDHAAAAAVLRGISGIGEVQVEAPGGASFGPGGVVSADLGSCPGTAAIAALVNAGIAVSTAAPRNRLEDVFLELVGAAEPASAGDTR